MARDEHQNDGRMRDARSEHDQDDEEFVDIGYESRAEKLAYLAGLAEGVERDEDPATASLLAGIVEVLADVSDDIGMLRREQRVLAEDMDELAEEVGVEPSDIVVECPSCGREVAFASGLLDQEDLELTCPNCGEVVYTPGEDEIVDEPDARQSPEPGLAGGQEGHGGGAGREGPEGHEGHEGHGPGEGGRVPHGYQDDMRPASHAGSDGMTGEADAGPEGDRLGG